MAILFLLGRLLYGGYFVWASLNHFTKNQALAQYAAAKKVPFSRVAVYLSGVFIFLGGLGIVLGVFINWAVLLIAIFLIIVTFKMHAYWVDTEPASQMSNRVNFGKNLALLGADLLLLAISQPWPLALF